MIRVRFHGRGGQGAKTASRILGTAAFREGLVAQDSPIYGAERRGAPVAAFVRVSTTPILERGIILRPNVVVVADESLLADPAAHVLEGVTKETAIFVNAPDPSDAKATAICPGRLTTLDLTGMAVTRFGRTTALSALLGAVAARLIGLRAESLRAAIVQELREVGLPEAAIEQNLALALDCFHTVPVVPLSESVHAPAPARLWTPTYDPPARGTPRIAAEANASLRKTGNWRTFRPVLVPEKCNGCWLCFVYCPDAAITMTDAELPVIDYDHCKGCLLCVEECPTQALLVEREPTRHEATESV